MSLFSFLYLMGIKISWPKRLLDKWYTSYRLKSTKWVSIFKWHSKIDDNVENPVKQLKSSTLFGVTDLKVTYLLSYVHYVMFCVQHNYTFHMLEIGFNISFLHQNIRYASFERLSCDEIAFLTYFNFMNYWLLITYLWSNVFVEVEQVETRSINHINPCHFKSALLMLIGDWINGLFFVD